MNGDFGDARVDGRARIRRVAATAVLIVILLASSGCARRQVVAPPDPAPAEPVVEPEPVRTQTYYSDGRDFVDGVAWVQESSGSATGERLWSCIDPTGAVLFTLDPGFAPTGDFSNGVAVVRGPRPNAENGLDTHDLLVDHTGAVLFPKGADTNDYTLLGPVNGYVVAERYVSDYKTAEYQNGIVDKTGAWVQEPLKSSQLHDLYEYEGIIWLGRTNLPGGEEVVGFDTARGEVFARGEGNKELIRRVVQYLYVEDMIYLDSGTTFDFDFPRYDYDRDLANPAAWGFEKGGKGFYDRAGAKVFGVSDTSWVPIGEFSDGYCTLRLVNPRGEGYYTIVDKTGAFMFEPRGVALGPVSKGLATTQSVDGVVECIDVRGAQVFTLSGVEHVGKYSAEGLAKVTGSTSYGGDPDGGVYYIDTTGAIAF